MKSTFILHRLCAVQFHLWVIVLDLYVNAQMTNHIRLQMYGLQLQICYRLIIIILIFVSLI